MIAVPSNNKQSRNTIRKINYYRDMWKYRSDILTPLIKMTCKQATWKWLKKWYRNIKNMMKALIGDTTIVYPNFNEVSVTGTDVSKV